jgi:hypothetical protein
MLPGFLIVDGPLRRIPRRACGITLRLLRRETGHCRDEKLGVRTSGVGREPPDLRWSQFYPKQTFIVESDLNGYVDVDDFFAGALVAARNLRQRGPNRRAAKVLRFLRCNEMEGHLISRPPGGADDAPRAACIKVRWVVDRSDRARTLRSARFSTGVARPYQRGRSLSLRSCSALLHRQAVACC